MQESKLKLCLRAPYVFLPCFTVGDYDVVIPSDTAAGEYKIRVGRFEDDDLFDCSDMFEIVSDEDDDDMSMSYTL